MAASGRLNGRATVPSLFPSPGSLLDARVRKLPVKGGHDSTPSVDEQGNTSSKLRGWPNRTPPLGICTYPLADRAVTGLKPRRRSELASTLTELKAIAPAAKTGSSRMPKAG